MCEHFLIVLFFTTAFGVYDKTLYFLYLDFYLQQYCPNQVENIKFLYFSEWVNLYWKNGKLDCNLIFFTFLFKLLKLFFSWVFYFYLLKIWMFFFSEKKIGFLHGRAISLLITSLKFWGKGGGVRIKIQK